MLILKEFQISPKSFDLVSYSAMINKISKMTKLKKNKKGDKFDFVTQLLIDLNLQEFQYEILTIKSVDRIISGGHCNSLTTNFLWPCAKLSLV